MYYVYVLQDAKGAVYVGYSENLKKRLSYHAQGSVLTTRDYQKTTLRWYCAFSSKKKALEFERYLKKGSGHAFARKHLL